MDQYIGAAWRAASRFAFEGMPEDLQVFGNGHINETYRLRFSIGRMGTMYVILQKINRGVFHDPERLMGNIVGVTSWLHRKITEEGGDPERETLSLIPAKDGRSFLVDDDGEYWRAYRFITDATSYDQAQSAEDFRQSAVAFGTFQRRLADYPADSLYESIPGFHDTAARFEAFKKAAAEDRVGRAGSVKDEIAFVLEHEELAHRYEEAGETIPLRVTHNDTKLNNVMIDDKTHKGICVIDLDTVMPGYVMNDFGDSIRFGASSAPEDECDLSKVFCRLDLFRAYTEGFLQACAGRLVPAETRLLADGALVMTYECGMRFLADYLQGDTYFRIHRPDQNLDRARSQFKLVADMERKLPQMRGIVEEAALAANPRQAEKEFQNDASDVC
jgi:hypothetical protein